MMRAAPTARRVAIVASVLVLAIGCATSADPEARTEPDRSTTTSTTGPLPTRPEPTGGKGPLLELPFDPTTASDASPGDGGALPRFGLAIGGGDPDRLAAVEEEAGAELGIVRIFTRWDTPFPTPDHRQLLDDGRILHVSVRPRTDRGEVIPWREVAEAEEGSVLHRQLVGLVSAIAEHGDQIYFTFNHEPETAASAPNGEAEEFVAAWRRTVELLRTVGGGEVRTVFVAGGGAYADRSVEAWYPGDDVVDVVGADLYNWHGCQGTNRPWRSASELIEAPLAFAVAHDKPLALPELASTEDDADPERKARWIAGLADTMSRPDVVGRVEFAAWFSTIDPAWPDCRWSYDSSTASAEALTAVIARFAAG